MSAPIKLTADQLRDLAAALDLLTKVRIAHDVDVAAYGRAEIRHIASDTTVSVRWDTDAEQYVIDDQVGG